MEGEERHLSELSLYSRFKILFINTFETVILAGMLCNAICAFNFSSINYIFISLCLIKLVATKNPAIQLKKTILKVNLANTCLIAVIKVVLGLTYVASSTKGKTTTQVTWLQAFGFSYDDDTDDLRFYKTLESEVASLCVTFVYFGFVILLQKASEGRAGIDRNLTRIIPISRSQQALHKADEDGSKLEPSDKKRNPRHGVSQSVDGLTDWVQPESKQEK